MKRAEKTFTTRADKVWTIVGVVLCVILLPMLIINCTLLVKGYTNQGKVPSVGGVFPMIVLTDSMSGTFESGDLIICHTAEPEDVKVGDVICFYDPMSSSDATVTHRVTAITTDEKGELAFKTKGDANNTEDTALVSGQDLVGIYQSHLSGVGSAALFMQSTPGLIVCVGVPVALLVVYDLLRRRKYEKKNQENTAALMAELERLRAEKERQNTPQ